MKPTPKGTTPAKGDDTAKLLAEVAELREQLAAEVGKRTAAEEAAKSAAAGQNLGLQYADVVEVPTGKTVSAMACSGYETVSYKEDGRPILKPIFKRMDVPTFFYKIDLPPSGGLSIVQNGIHFYHGETYEMTLDQLRSVKDMVFRSWAHERSIRGDDENERSYRRPTNARFSGRSGTRTLQ